MGFQTGDLHPLYFRGFTINKKGHKRITTKVNRNKLEHRLIAERMIENPLCLPCAVPSKYEIHHFDGVGTHNCEGNLQFLAPEIHRWIPSQKKVNKRILSEIY